MADQLLQTLQQAFQRNTKSTVLKSLGWLIALILPATIFASKYGSDKWLVVMFAILDCLAILVYIAAFIFFALKDPEQLRSEKFSIQKLAIQHGIIGDDISGFVKITKVGGLPLLENSSTDEKGKECK